MGNQEILTNELMNQGNMPGSLTNGGPVYSNDYQNYLLALQASFVSLNSWLLVGEMPKIGGWIIHISVVKQQIHLLAGRLFPYLLDHDLPFVIPANEEKHNHILDGRAGLPNVGKVVSIYIGNQEGSTDIIKPIIDATSELIGPEVFIAAKLAECVFVSYGVLSPESTVNVSCYSPLSGFNARKFLKQQQRLKDISWPFAPLAIIGGKPKGKLIKNQYLSVQSLKNDPKGNVLKCIKLNSLYNMEWCVLKQGRKHQCHDSHNRDMRDRLLWQYKCHRLLEGRVKMPRVIDLFEITGDSWLAMEYIDGVPLSARINQIHEGTAWLAIEISMQCEVFAYLFQVIAIIDGFHENGMVHRDLNPGNFLVGSDGLVTAIDIELAYNLNTAEPSPAFTAGTPGYISPQQMRNETPEIADDLFGLGALLMKSFTGLSPNKFNTADPALQEQLMYFIGFYPLVDLIIKCLQPSRESRPESNVVKSCLVAYESFLSAGSFKEQLPSFNDLSSHSIKEAVVKGLNGLGNEALLGAHLEWRSLTEDNSNLLANEFCNYAWSPGFHSGASGVLYTLAVAEKAGFSTVDLLPILYRNIEFLEEVIGDFQNLQPGLWKGSYGIAYAFKALIEAGLLENKLPRLNQIYQLMTNDCYGLNIADGLAGQGAALLECSHIPHFPCVINQLNQIVSALIGQQQTDGSWLVSKAISQAPIKMIGFAYGTAGITCFLLAYYNLHQKSHVKIAIEKALNWLINQRMKVNGQWIWLVNPKNKMIDPWLEYGFTGVALTFIKAYEVLKVSRYKEMATSALLIHPQYISSNYLTLANGLAGLGEVYLEAFRVFNEKEWLVKARHIGGLLIHNCKKVDADVIYWLDGNQSNPSAGMMNGNSGILHYLIRLLNPGKVGFPLLKSC